MSTDDVSPMFASLQQSNMDTLERISSLIGKPFPFDPGAVVMGTIIDVLIEHDIITDIEAFGVTVERRIAEVLAQVEADVKQQKMAPRLFGVDGQALR